MRQLVRLLLLVKLLCLTHHSCAADETIRRSLQEELWSFADLPPCSLSTTEMKALGPSDELAPCLLLDTLPNTPSNATTTAPREAVLTVAMVTDARCGEWRDGAATGIEQWNSGKIKLGFHQDYTVQFRFVSVVAGNQLHMDNAIDSTAYPRQHVAILEMLLTELDVHYIVGTCSFHASLEREVALKHETLLVTQVGPPGFYAGENPWLFGMHLNSDSYPLDAVRRLLFWTEAGTNTIDKSSVPVKVIYRRESEFFYSTCQSAIQALQTAGFTVDEILYHHADDHDQDGESNEVDVDFLYGLADQACPAEDTVSPALFLCTRTEHTAILERLTENGCMPISLWLTASTWGWASDNPDVVPYFQGGGQWHEAFTYEDAYFDSGAAVLEYNEQKYGYRAGYDQLVSYAIPILFGQHLQTAYRVQDDPDPIRDFADPTSREVLRRQLVSFTGDTIFGPVAFNQDQRNVGRGAASTQWLPSVDGSMGYRNALVSPLQQAEAAVVLPAGSADECQAGSFINETAATTHPSLLSSKCEACPADSFSLRPNRLYQCEQCPAGAFSERGETSCVRREDHLLSAGVLAFGYSAMAIVWILGFGFLGWVVWYRNDPVVRIAQLEFLVLICVGSIISSSSILLLSFQAGHEDDETMASRACMALPFLYTTGWILQYASLMAKTFRLYKIMNNPRMQRLKVSAQHGMIAVCVVLLVDWTIVSIWTAINPLEYVRTITSTNVDQEIGLETIHSVGRCNVEGDPSLWAFVGPILGLHLLLVIGTNIMLFKVKQVSERYQEQKYIAFAALFVLEVLVIGIPVLIAASESPEATHIVLTGVIAVDAIGVLCFIFIPKIIYQKEGLEAGVGVGESILRNTHSNAVKRETIRRESSVSHLSRQIFGNEGSSSGSCDTTPRASTGNSSNMGAAAAEINAMTSPSMLEAMESIIEEDSKHMSGEFFNEKGDELPTILEQGGSKSEAKSSTRQSDSEVQVFSVSGEEKETAIAEDSSADFDSGEFASSEIALLKNRIQQALTRKSDISMSSRGSSE